MLVWSISFNDTVKLSMAAIFYSAMEINFDFASSIVILFIWFQIIIKKHCF